MILHADDLGVARSENAASLDALDTGAANSASIMIPTPWVTDAAQYAKDSCGKSDIHEQEARR